MYNSLLLTAITALPLLFPPTALAKPYPRRALKEARSPAPQTDYDAYIPYPIDSRWLVWNTHGDGPLNKAIVAGYEYMKTDPPKYDWSTDYADDEGIYAYDEEALYAYEETIGVVYGFVNEHATYDKYEFDYDYEIGYQDDEYCVWWYGKDGPCWFNALIKYGEELFKEDGPYRVKARSDEKDWAVYATSVDLNKDYAKVLWDFLIAVDGYGGMDWEYEWKEVPDKV